MSKYITHYQDIPVLDTSWGLYRTFRTIKRSVPIGGVYYPLPFWVALEYTLKYWWRWHDKNWTLNLD